MRLRHAICPSHGGLVAEVLSYREDPFPRSPQLHTVAVAEDNKGGEDPFDSARRVCFLVLNAALFELRECVIRDIEASRCSTFFQNMLYIRTLYYALRARATRT